MTENATATDKLEFSEDGKANIPSGLKVLTILTFVGCGIGILFTLLMPLLYKFLLGMMAKAQTSGTELKAKQLEDIEKSKAMMELAQANIVPLIAISIIGIALCMAGAIMMRKLKKDGYWLYIGGELMPVIGTFIILGTAQFTGVTSIIMGLGLPLLFVILYTLQRKHLVH